MALVLADRVRDTTTTTGTGTVTLSGTAPTGYQNFSVVGNGNTTYYTINAGSQWEVGIGTYSSTGPTLSRDTVLSSSSSGSLVDFAAGTKDVFLTYPSGKSVYQDGSAIKAGSAILAVPNGGTGAATLTGYVKGTGTAALTASATIPAGDITGAALTEVDDTNVTLTLGGSPSTALLAATSITAGWTGQLAVSRGGTGASTLSSGYLLKGNGTSAVSASVVYDNGTNVGIGTVSPSYALSVVNDGSYTKAGADTFSSIIYMNKGRGSVIAPTNISSGDNLGAIWFNGYSGSANNGGYGYGAYIGGQADGPVYVGTVPGRLVFATTSSGTSSPTERMRIDSSGNVGIGTSSPTQKLEVNGQTVTGNITVKGDGTEGGQITLNNAANSAAVYAFDVDGGGNGRLFTTTNNANLQLGQLGGTGGIVATFTGGSERMRIDTSGNVGIGTTSPAQRIHAATTAAVSGTTQSFLRLTGDATYGADFGGGIIQGVGPIATISTVNAGTATERMRIDSSGNVGIGTTSPGALLQLNKASGAADLRFSVAGTLYANMYASSSDVNIFATAATPLILGTTNTERMRISSTGNVGINTTTPSTNLEVNGGIIAGGENRQTHPPTGPVGFKAQWNYTGGFGETDFYNLYSVASDSFRFYQTTGSGTAQLLYDIQPSTHLFYTGGNERMRIDSSGNVGIGTSSPQSKMEIRSTSGGSVVNALTLSNYVGASAGTGVALHFDPNGAGTLARAASIQSVQSTSGNYADLRFFTANSDTPAERMRIGVNGGVAIGGTGTDATLHIQTSYGGFDRLTQMSPSAASKDAFNIIAAKNASSVDLWWSWGVDTSNRWRINQGVGFSTNGMAITDTGNVGMGTLSPSGKLHVETTGTGDVIYIAANTGGTAGQSVYVIPVRTAGTLRGGLQWNGTNLLYNNSSDSRLKENVADADDAASLIDAIQVRKFDWKESGSHQRYGFIAQELIKVAPEAVHQPEDAEEMMGVDYSKLVPMLIKEVQSLRARVAQLEGK